MKTSFSVITPSSSKQCCKTLRGCSFVSNIENGERGGYLSQREGAEVTPRKKVGNFHVSQQLLSTIEGVHALYQPPGVEFTVCAHSRYHTGRHQATMGNYLGLIRPHQHGMADACALTVPFKILFWRNFLSQVWMGTMPLLDRLMKKSRASKDAVFSYLATEIPQAVTHQAVWLFDSICLVVTVCSLFIIASR